MKLYKKLTYLLFLLHVLSIMLFDNSAIAGVYTTTNLTNNSSTNLAFEPQINDNGQVVWYQYNSSTGVYDIYLAVTTRQNNPPVANAGLDQPKYVGDTVTLDGSGSSDADGNLLTYRWAFTTKPDAGRATLGDAAAVNPTFTVDKAGTYVVSLFVYDGTVNSETDTVTISTLNSAPVASAGSDQSAYVNNTVTLDGSGSSDVDGNLLTYSWAFTTKPDGSTTTLSDATAVNPTFTVDKAGTYVVSLFVYDGTVNSETDTVTITVQDTTVPVVSNTTANPNPVAVNTACAIIAQIDDTASNISYAEYSTDGGRRWYSMDAITAGTNSVNVSVTMSGFTEPGLLT